MKKIDWFHCIIAFFLIVCTTLVLFITWESFKPLHIIDVEKPHNISVNKKDYSPGDTVEYTFNYCKYMDLPSTGSYTLVNNIMVPYSKVQSNSGVGCYSKKASIILPVFLDGGEYYFIITHTYKVNHFREETFVYQTQTFNIVR